jgi:carboxyl-terminal processing protease
MKKLILGIMIFFSINLFGATIPTSEKSLDVLKQALLIIKSSYVKAGLSDKKLIYGAINGMVKTLNDPFTNFLTPEEYGALNNETSGEFGGIGIIVTLKDNLVTVISPIYDSPAERAGIVAGDIITSVNNEQIKRGELKKALTLLKGELGTTVEISIFNPQTKKQDDLTLTREIIKDTSIVYAGITPENYGYVRIRNFSASTPNDLEQELINMKKVGIKGFILDLRSNPGGLLTAGIKTANLFLKFGTILTTRSRDGDQNVYLADSQKAYTDFPMVILIDRGSASAAEIVSAALHDNKRAILVGERSFGKGCVQTVRTLEDGSALSLTTAWYYTPAGICIHNKGIKPDITVQNPLITDKEKLKELIKKIRKDQQKSYQEMMLHNVYHFKPEPSDKQLLRGIQVLDEFWKFRKMYEKYINTAN